MKDVREILTEKETELQQLKKEVDSLRLVVPLLDEGGPVPQGQQAPEACHAAEPEASAEPGPKPPQSADADNLFSSVEKADTGFWRLGKRRKHG
jgi:hypothetical protein